MTQGDIERLRHSYHRSIFEEVLRKGESGAPNNADSASATSVRISNGIIDRIGFDVSSEGLAGQTAGSRFESLTRDFLREAFKLLQHIRPGDWVFALGGNIRDYEQYSHLSEIRNAVRQNKELRIVFGDYIVTPDITVCRKPVSDEEINRFGDVLSDDEIALYTPLRYLNSQVEILHASVSCKWTIRSDRSQNARTEGLNLIRNRKGKTPHIVVVTGEPLPARIASLAFGTGDIDCVYHFALRELIDSATESESDTDLLNTLVAGRRLRDISDLPFDLAT
ncbi:MAG: restriction endonuclease [Gemmatimonadetes bacterium]|nr:restriction endonuclease [Gemmatimonadota bacterium]MYI98064.1 restriction endonuclease [Gemmatimonadota bacterium]